MVNPKDVTCAFIGTGRMGIRHIQAAKMLGMPVVGVTDLAPEAAKNACSSEGLSANIAYRDTGLMLKQTRPQAVVIATTAPSHSKLVIAAAAAGVQFILCEKPLACSLAEADLMLETCMKHGVKLAVNHQMAFMPNYFRIRQLIEAGRVGPLVSIQVAGSNFGLAMNGSHYFEMFRYITGHDVNHVQAWLEEEKLANPRGIQFSDYSGQVRALNDTGQSLFMDFSSGAGHGLQCTYICKYAQITVDELAGSVRMTSRVQEYRDLPTTRYGMPAKVENIEIEPVDVVMPTVALWRAMLSGEPFPRGEGAGVHALRCLVAAHSSHSKGGALVSITDETLPNDQLFQWA